MPELETVNERNAVTQSLSAAVPAAPDSTSGHPGSDGAELGTLFRRSSQFLGGQICLFVLGFASFPILARLFTVADYGLIALVQNTVAVAAVFSKFGLQHSVQRFYKENEVSPEPGRLRRYYSSLFLGASGVGLGVMALFLVALWLTPRQWISADVQRLMAFASALIFIRSVQSMITNLLQVEGNAKAYNLTQIGMRAATIVATVTLLITWKTTPMVFFLAMILVEIGTVLLLLPYLRQRRLLALGDFEASLLRGSMAFGLPMMTTELCWLILDAGDRFLVQGFLGAQPLGYYAAAYNISTYIRESLAAPLGLALFPICMELWITKGKEQTQNFLSRSLDHFMLLGVGLVCTASVCSREVIHILASPKFLEAHRLLPYLIVGQLVSSASMFHRVGLLIHKRTYSLMRVIALACVLNVAMNVVLLPRMGLLGAAIATLASYLFTSALFFWESQPLLPLEMEWVAWGRYIAVGVASWAVASRVNLENNFVELALKGALSLTLYFGALWLIDRRVRRMTLSLLQAVFGRRPAPAAPTAG